MRKYSSNINPIKPSSKNSKIELENKEIETEANLDISMQNIDIFPI